MGSIEKIGNDYYIEFYARGLKYQQKIGPNREAAQKALETIETKIASGETAIIVRDVDYDIFFEDFLKNACLAHGFKTIKRYASTIEDFKNFLLRECPAVKSLSEITPRLIEQYRASLRERKRAAKKPLKPKVINLTLFLLRDILEFAIKLGYLNDNPTLHIKLVKEPGSSRPDYLSDEEIRLILKVSDADSVAISEFILLTGSTPRELCHLKWADIDVSMSIIKIRSGTEREVAIVPSLKELLEKLKGKRRDSSYVFVGLAEDLRAVRRIEKKFSEVALKSGILRNVSFFMLRHTFARNLCKKGISLNSLYKLMGFSDIGQAMIYSRFLGDYLEKDIYKSQ